MKNLITVNSTDDILPEYQNTPIQKLLAYQNLKMPLDAVSSPELLVGMCMDNRKHLRIPENFAYIIRSGGANLRYSEFKVSYAIAVGGVRHIALLAHNGCGMVNIFSRKDEFIEGLVNNAGWKRESAEAHFMNYAIMFEIDNEVDFVVSEANRLRLRHPKISVCPLYYRLEDNQLYLIDENS